MSAVVILKINQNENFNSYKPDPAFRQALVSPYENYEHCPLEGWHCLSILSSHPLHCACAYELLPVLPPVTSSPHGFRRSLNAENKLYSKFSTKIVRSLHGEKITSKKLDSTILMKIVEVLTKKSSIDKIKTFLSYIRIYFLLTVEKWWVCLTLW